MLLALLHLAGLTRIGLDNSLFTGLLQHPRSAAPLAPQPESTLIGYPRSRPRGPILAAHHMGTDALPCITARTEVLP